MNLFRAAVFVLAGIFLIAGGAWASALEDITAALDASEDIVEIKSYEAELVKLTEVSTGAEKVPVLVQLARARYLLGESESLGDGERIGYLDGAISAADKAMALDPDDGWGLYWKSMALLMKADVDGGISSLGMVKDALKGFETVQKSEPAYDDAGAYRSHAKVLIEIPSWTFMSDSEAAVRMLEKAVEIAPGSILNRLYLAQAYVEEDRRDDARAELEYLLKSPGNTRRPIEDAEIREEARSLLGELE